MTKHLSAPSGEHHVTVSLRPLDWLPLIAAVLAIAIGVYVQPPVCIQSYGPPVGAKECVEWRFPFEFASGIALAVIAVALVITRVRRKPIQTVTH